MNIILSPHFDDAVLSLGGLLAQEGKDTAVATFFAGVPEPALVRKWDTTCGFKDSTEAMRERTLEDKKSLGYFGVRDENIRTYAHLDAQYRLSRKKSDPDVPEPELEAAISKEIISLVQEFAAQPLKVFIPGFGIHTDHARVLGAALVAVKECSNKKNIEFFFYQDLPYALKILEKAHPRTMWNYFTYKNPGRWDYVLLKGKIIHGSFNIEPHSIALSEAEMSKKLAGLECYPSQVNNLDVGLLKKLKRFSAAQARSLNMEAPYCEVVYACN